MDSLRQRIVSTLPSWTHLRSLLTDPPFAPPNVGPVDSPLAVKYLPLLVLLVLFWPVFVTLLIALGSTSAWLFWLVTSLIFGSIQLIYVMYNFGMISVDIVTLSILKTFALLRSQVRYYTIKSGLVKSGNRAKRGRRGRRREWRNELDEASCYDDYVTIEIEEPPPEPTVPSSGAGGSSKSKTAGGAGGTASGGGGGGGSSAASRRRRRRARQQAARRTSSADVSETTSDADPSSSSSSSIMRKSQSCVDLEGVLASGADTVGAGGPPSSSPRRSGSSDNLVLTTKSHSMDGPSSSSSSKTTAGSNNKETMGLLGMNGAMLLATTARLREARSQASAAALVGRPPRRPLPTLTPMDEKKLEEDDEEEVEEGDHERVDDGVPARIEAAIGVGNHGKDGDNDDNEKDKDGAAASLKFLLTGVVKRNHLSMDDMLIENARSVAERGQHQFDDRSRRIIESYGDELERCLDWLAESTPPTAAPSMKSTTTTTTTTAAPPTTAGAATGSSSSSSPLRRAGSADDDAAGRLASELFDRINLVRKLKRNMGRTALMLSGGGAQAMYHLGTIKAFVESGVYDDVTVISGTSGGSITAAMCAIKSGEELLRDVCVKTVSTDYLHTGEMKRKNIRWFPKLVDMGSYWLKHKLMVDSADFKRCCDFYYGDITFEEAFERTGKHVCITVSASRVAAGSGKGAQRLLLNHISTPHVTISSAVGASCALPGVMAPAKLMVKNSSGKQEPFEVDGVEWIDGSVQADLPFQRISTLFNVSNYIVAQTNFHVVPFLNKAHHPNVKSFYWQIFQTCEWDIRNRALNLSRLGLFPRIFGQDMSKVFKQKYHGNLTLVPRFTTMQVFGLKALVNPTVQDMEIYLQNGQVAAWPYLSVIREMLRMERAIDKCLARLEERVQAATPDWKHMNDDDLESISSNMSAANRGRFASVGRETELLKQKVHNLEVENASLRKKLEQLHHALGLEKPRRIPDNCIEEKKSAEDTGSIPTSIQRNLGEVWTEVRKRKK